MLEPDDRDALEVDVNRAHQEADAILAITEMRALRDVVLHAIRELTEARKWLTSSEQLGEAGSNKLARISLTAASERLAYVRQLRETYGPGLMFRE